MIILLNNLSEFLNVSTIDIVMGDFNIIYFNDTTMTQLRKLMDFYA